MGVGGEMFKVPSGKVPLKYQSTKFDCVPIVFFNALNYLFDTQEIPPEVIQRIMLYCLDTIGKNGEYGKRGTTGLACEFIIQWLNQYSKRNNDFCLECEYITGEEVHLRNNNKLVRYINGGGVGLCSVSSDRTGKMYHYLLCTKADNNYLYFFDPYYRHQQYRKPDSDYLECIRDEWSYNLKVSRERLDLATYEKYSFGPIEYREICLIKRSF